MQILNYAHRGASEYAPENTALSFALGILQGANAIETDVRKSADGVLYLFHDSTLDRVTDRTGSVQGLMWAELQEIRVCHPLNPACDRILSLEHFLQLFGWQKLQFAIEIKEEGIAGEVLQMLNRYEMREKTVITSTMFSALQDVKLLDPAWRIGWLLKEPSDEDLARLADIGGEQVCPNVKYLTPELSREWHQRGFEVRAWNCKTPDLMLQALRCGVEGMTVNFPDRLKAYLDNHPCCS